MPEMQKTADFQRFFKVERKKLFAMLRLAFAACKHCGKLHIGVLTNSAFYTLAKIAVTENSDSDAHKHPSFLFNKTKYTAMLFKFQEVYKTFLK